MEQVLSKYPSISEFRTVISEVRNRAQYLGRDEDGKALYDHSVVPPTLVATGTVKAHGCNASVVLTRDGKYYAQSREQILLNHDDCYYFLEFAEKNKDFFIEHLRARMGDFDRVAIYGEWCGEDIQKKSSLRNLEKFYYIFEFKGIYDDERESFYTDDIGEISCRERRIITTKDVGVWDIKIDFSRAELSQQTLINATNAVEESCPIAEAFGRSGMVGEGMVWQVEFKGRRLRFKVKGQKHSVTKVKKLAEVDVVKITTVREFVKYAVTDSRLEQGISVMEQNNVPIVKENAKHFIDWVIRDVIKEETDTMTANGVTTADFGKYGASIIAGWFLNYLKKVH